ncbi:MAG: hypothetical protein AAGG38_08585 [Planctomycetota bacterium]
MTALDAEANTLRRAQAAVRTADRHLVETSDLLADAAALRAQLDRRSRAASDVLLARLMNTRAAITRITTTAAFQGVPLFDGRYSLRVGGGRLELPDLVHSAPTRAALALLRGELEDFDAGIVSPRLQVVQDTLRSTATAGPLICDAGRARETAALLRTQTLGPGLAAGALVDVTA